GRRRWWWCAGSLSWLTSVFDELRGDWRRAAAPPPCDGDQERKAAEEPGEGGGCVGEQGVAGILVAGDRRRNRLSRQRVDERQDFAMARRAVLARAAAIGILDLAIGFLARAAHHALARGSEPDDDVGHDPLELEENVAPQIDVARVFRSEMNRDDQGLAQVGERALIGGGKGVAPVLREIDRCYDLRGHGANRGSDGDADPRPNELGAQGHAGMQPYRRERDEAPNPPHHAPQH